MQSPGFKLLEVARAEDEGPGYVRMRFNLSDSEEDKKGLALRGGWVLLDSKHDWVVRKAQLQRLPEGKPTELTIENDFKDGSEGNPIITRARQYSIRKVNGKFVYSYEIVANFDLHEQVSVPEHEFMLSAYGLPEPYGSEPAPTRWYLWVGLAGFICLMTGLFLARWRRSSK
jgi:hypothetical protein